LSLQTFMALLKHQDEWIFLNLKNSKCWLILHTTHLATRVEEYLQSVDATKRLELLVLVIVAMRTFWMCYYCRENVWSYHYSTRKYLRGRTEENNQSNTRGIASSGQDVTYEIIPKETEAIKHAIKFAEEGSITCLSDGY
jgi:cyanophycin synthetase